MMEKHLLIVLSGPSGVGKGTVVERLLQKGGYSLSISCTTRAPRAGEEDGKSYFFIDRQTFLAMAEAGGFLEYSQHFGNLYGTPRAFVEERLKTHDVILEIEVDGALRVKEAHPEALLIMLLPPSEEELRLRLFKRGTESAEKIEERCRRLSYELSKRDAYDFTVVNDDISAAVAEIEQIIAEKKAK